ncbi:MAG: prepilin-type N-terminal cleavage/methylation domain-containing protein [Solobacterium sp.]|jgi:competence protein ComGC|nr:prepilin-type N-terminal cleavage/methylation domain-containing protein [Solobacterium sp.]MCH4049855.1 prepilin-type N-terminal cleavage/methylation domain-containing protein [Solobacterium sp.]MCH4073540.1 prepilin-type N-terminal cleavage/methylation domain-containing protein [Solobacterium sp.]MCI1312911.1 prepilin-type N-terminal cleavage/methylation domain-containing protein [Solobacterium sp.]MCI1347187.1 prepilin-type N-terminal cleavage/methylation domain-containing protein [Solobac
MKRRRKTGFTLLEMIVVVLIVSVLFLLTVPNIKDTIGIVNNRGCKALEKVADSAIVEYKMKYDEYPGSIGDLVNAGLLTEDQTTCDGNKTLTISDGTAHISD